MGPVTSLNKQIVTQHYTKRYSVYSCVHKRWAKNTQKSIAYDLSAKNIAVQFLRKTLFLEFVLVRQKQVKIF